MSIVNAYRVAPDEIKPGDEMLFVVKALVLHIGSAGKVRYRIYRCPWGDSAAEGVPQGSPVLHQAEVCQAFFPSLAQVGEPG